MPWQFLAWLDILMVALVGTGMVTNRPEWVAIPLNGILRVLAKVSGETNAASPQP